MTGGRAHLRPGTIMPAVSFQELNLVGGDDTAQWVVVEVEVRGRVHLGCTAWCTLYELAGQIGRRLSVTLGNAYKQWRAQPSNDAHGTLAYYHLDDHARGYLVFPVAVLKRRDDCIRTIGADNSSVSSWTYDWNV